MKQLQRKLKSNRGASMILVLALFLICVMVSSTIITAAASGSSRNLHRTAQQQAYLAVSSATDIFVEEFQEMGTFVGKTTDKKYGCEDCTVPAGVTNGYWLDASLIPNNMNEGYIIFIEGTHGDSGQKVDVDEEATTIDGPLADLMMRATEKVYVKNTSYTETFTMAVDAFNEERLPEVICKFTMDDDYSVEIVLTTTNSDYSITIASAANGEKKTTFDDEGKYVTCEHEIFYKELVDGAFVDRYTTMKNIPGKLNDSIVTVTWGNPKVTKGVGSQ